jgi:hypothetical protein
MKQILFVCRCASLEHLFVVSAEEEDLFIETHLAPLPFFERLKHAVRYLFGYRSKYGDFDEIVLDARTALDLGDYLVRWAEGDTYEFPTNDVH